jgi:hypothetical protein
MERSSSTTMSATEATTHATTISSGRLDHLPDDALLQILFYLSGYDIVNLLSINKELREWEKEKRKLKTSTNASSSSSSSSTIKKTKSNYSEKIWSLLVQEHDRGESAVGNTINPRFNDNTGNCTVSWNEFIAKEQYFLYTLGKSLRSVRWLLTVPDTANDVRRRDGRVQRISGTTNTNTPSEREGHLSCTMYNDSIWIVTGGFTDDMTVYIKEIVQSVGLSDPDETTPTNGATEIDTDEVYTIPSWITVTPSMIDGSAQRRQTTTSHHPQFMNAVENDSMSFEWVYGGTLTTIGDNRAVRFGGFRSGGYSMESSQIAILEVNRTKRQFQQQHNEFSQGSYQQQYDYTASWIVQPCSVALTSLGEREGKQGQQIEEDGINETVRPAPVLSPTDPRIRSWWHPIASRAYHSATYLFDRYLLVLGGMKSTFSTFDPILLDTTNWIWYHEGITETPVGDPPSNRFGHSIITDFALFSKNRCVDWDQKRLGNESDTNTLSTRRRSGRLLLFGGGNGSDLLRSGHDNAQVWELDLHLDRCYYEKRQQCTTSVTHNTTYGDYSDVSIADTLPWTWKVIHADNNNPYDNESNGKVNDTDSLSPSERLMLGRCHVGIKVTNHTALFLFGSGNPTTNGVLGYDLETDTFTRPNIIGPLPLPRFTFACSYIKHLGFILVHGGYSTQTSEMTQDICILDIAPSLDYMYKKNYSHRKKYASMMFVLDDSVSNDISYGPVTDEHVLNVSEANQRLERANAILEYFLTVSNVQGQFFQEGDDNSLHVVGQVGNNNNNDANQDTDDVSRQRQQQQQHEQPERMDAEILRAALAGIGFYQEQIQDLDEVRLRDELIRLLLAAATTNDETE